MQINFDTIVGFNLFFEKCQFTMKHCSILNGVKEIQSTIFLSFTRSDRH